MRGVVRKAEKEIASCTQKTSEIHVTELFVVSTSEQVLPLQIEDAARPIDDSSPLSTVNLDTRLDNRLASLDSSIHSIIL